MGLYVQVSWEGHSEDSIIEQSTNHSMHNKVKFDN